VRHSKFAMPSLLRGHLLPRYLTGNAAGVPLITDAPLRDRRDCDGPNAAVSRGGKKLLFDHLVGTAEKRQRNAEARVPSLL
jgi:hypothetical protein